MARKGFKALKVQVNKKGYGRCQGRELRTASKLSLSRGNFATLSVTTVRQKSCSAASAMAVAAVVN